MKTLFINLLLFIPAILVAQQNRNESSSVDSSWKNVGNAGFTTGAALLTKLAFSPSGQP